MEETDPTNDDPDPEERLIRRWLRRADDFLRLARRRDAGKQGGEKMPDDAAHQRDRSEPRP